MNLVDLVHKALTVLYQRNGDKKYYSSFEVWLYLEDECKNDLIKLGYELLFFTQFDMDKEILRLLGDNNGKPFRVQVVFDEDGLTSGTYWIPPSITL